MKKHKPNIPDFSKAKPTGVPRGQDPAKQSQSGASRHPTPNRTAKPHSTSSKSGRRGS